MTFTLHEGKLYRCEDGREELYDFNQLYRGYYDPCRFTAVTSAGGLYLAAGMDDHGRAHLFTSLMGSVWEERPLLAQDPLLTKKTLRGSVMAILGEEDRHQIYLVTDLGELAVLPDCVRCNKFYDLLPAGSPEVVRAILDEIRQELVLTLADGSAHTLPLERLRRRRCSYHYGAGLLRQGAVLVELDGAESGLASWIPEAERAAKHIQCDTDALPDVLGDVGRSVPILFICRTGSRADEAARWAEEKGFTRAYSMGGTEALTHVE